MDIKKLNAQIKTLATKSSNWRDAVQLCMVGCAQFAFDDSNVDPATRLVKAVKGADMTAIIHWMEEHMPVIWVKSSESFRFNKSFVGQYDAITLMSEAWWELCKKPKNVNSSIDVIDSVRSLIKRIENEIASGKKTVSHAEALADLKALAGKFAQVEA